MWRGAMKIKIHKVLAVALIVFGLMSAAVAIDDFARGSREDIVLGIFMSMSFVIAGILIRRRLKSGQAPCWRMMLGGSMIFFAVTGLGVELDCLITNTSEDLAVGLVMAAMFSVGGYFLVRSGCRRSIRGRRPTVEEQLRASFASSPERFENVEVRAADETVAAGSYDRGRR
jgi:hypothetical protein